MLLERQLLQVLQEKFHLEDFRIGQKEAILAILSKKNVLINFPTGGGKSLIYQLTSLFLKKKITLVISPLIALMKDQVEFLQKKEILAAYYNSAQDELEQMKILSHCIQHKYKILYISPEKALSTKFLTIFQKMDIGLIAIDEAHCISQWGFDFRPEYRRLYHLVQMKNCPILAATATATEKVQKDIISSFQTKTEFLTIQSSYFRKNLHFYVKKCTKDEEKNRNLLHWLQKFDFFQKEQKAIIYCSTRKKVEKIYQFLKLHKIKIEKYHAGLSITQREKIQNSFLKNKNILVTTNAFGMGINISSIDVVIHYNLPSSLENYYQEAGRAGRNGQKAFCILLYSMMDFRIQKMILKGKSLEPLQPLSEYLASRCRQKFICKYFGEDIPNCQKCDSCLNLSQQEKTNLEVNFEHESIKKIESQKIINLIELENGKLGKTNLIKILRGSKSQSIQNFETSVYYGIFKNYREIEVKNAVEELINKKIIIQKNRKFPKLYSVKKNSKLEKKQTLESKLKNFRLKTAKKLKWKIYMVFSNDTLQEILQNTPKTIEDLKQIKGLGEKKIEKFGLQLLETIN